MVAKYDWPTIKRTFVVGHNVSLKGIARHYSIPYQTVRRKAAEERWTGCRLTYVHFGVYCETALEQRRIFRQKYQQEVERIKRDYRD